jgi:type III pantothenate kinase
MLLAIDIGNTSAFFGCFEGKRLTHKWRLETRRATEKTVRRSLSKNLPGSARYLEGACVSSVVPHLNKTLKKVIKKDLKCPSLFVCSKNAGIKIRRYNKRQIGADRLVNAVAAYKKYKRPCIVIDFGTASTFDYVNQKGEYAGGVIAPGIGIINDALSSMAAKLPKVKIKKTKRIVAQNTKHSMQAGVFHGYTGLVRHIIDSMKKETRTQPKVIATGGFANLFAKEIRAIGKIEPLLTLEGLRIIWDLNR